MRSRSRPRCPWFSSRWRWAWCFSLHGGIQGIRHANEHGKPSPTRRKNIRKGEIMEKLDIRREERMAVTNVDALVVGAGFAGLFMLHRLRELGLRAQAVEAGMDVGGAWYWNCYPGARCDIESIEYSYSFSHELQQEWSWTERYATQPEILRYARHVAERFDLRRDILFGTAVVTAAFDEARARWRVATDRAVCYEARFLIMATGCLSVPHRPAFAGSDDFNGEQYHTARWPRERVSFSGKRVAVIGTGSSGIQVIPMIAREAERVVVFQRTPNFSLPARNAPLTPNFARWVKENYAAIRTKARRNGLGMVDPATDDCQKVDPETRMRRFEAFWERGGTAFLFAFRDLKTDIVANRAAADFIHDKIREIVRDPAVAAALMPTDHPLGTKRICVDTDYYLTFNRSNVTLVDARNTPVERIFPQGIQTADQRYLVDAIVYATGFDALTGALLAVDLRGKAGRSLQEKWAAGPRTYLGLATSGFPNLFMINGP